MPSNAPDSVTNPRQRQLWRDISRVFEDYCGDDVSKYPEREREFIEIVDMIHDSLDLAPRLRLNRVMEEYRAIMEGSREP